MSRKLKFWNGRWGRNQHAYVAAYSQADAVALINSVTNNQFTLHEIQKYWSPCWGNPMKGVTPERGLWVETDNRVPVRVNK